LSVDQDETNNEMQRSEGDYYNDRDHGNDRADQTDLKTKKPG